MFLGFLCEITSRTSVNFASEAKYCFANACADYRAVLRFVVDDLVLAVFDVLSRCLVPYLRQRRERLEFVT